MKQKPGCMFGNDGGSRVWVMVGVIVSVLASGVLADTNNVIGTHDNWPTNWIPVASLNDPNDGLANRQLDFVGDASSPGGYYRVASDYVYFRMRVQLGTNNNSFTDAHFVLINVASNNYSGSALVEGTDDGYPDYGFAWDSKANDPTKHGLEMMVRETVNNSWGGVKMDDIDLQSAQKLINDINGNSRTTDGYLRTIDRVATPTFGETTFVDFAVSWSYLYQYTGLRSNQLWKVAFASIANATDHNFITGDVSGGASPASLVTEGWSNWGSTTPTTTSSGIDLRAYQGADGVYVEFVAYGVEQNGEADLILLGAGGQEVWRGTTQVKAGERFVYRFVVPNLVLGGTYDFIVNDEVGKQWTLNGVTVQPFAAEMISMTLTGVTLSFDSLPGRDYEVQWTERLNSGFSPLTNVTAVSGRTTVFVAHPKPNAASGFFRIRAQ
jgi:hypothetical protein